MSLSQAEQIANIIQALATVVQAFATLAALALGGAWTVWLYVNRRERYPRASIEHLVTHKPLGGGKSLLHVGVRLCNLGEALMSVERSETRIQRVLPVPTEVADSIKRGLDPVQEGETEVEWPLIGSHDKVYGKGECEIEPDESQDFNHDFIVETDIQTVVIYSYVMNEEKPDRLLAWNLTTLYDLAGPASAHSPITGG